jgi:hypothetical protein
VAQLSALVEDLKDDQSPAAAVQFIVDRVLSRTTGFTNQIGRCPVSRVSPWGIDFNSRAVATP